MAYLPFQPGQQPMSSSQGVVIASNQSPVSVTGTVNVGNFGNQSVSGTVQVDVRASIGAVIIGGSIATATTNSSVMLLNSTNVIGSVMMLQGTNPFIITGSIQGGGAGTQYLENAITPSVTGTAVMFKSNVSSSIVSVVTPSTPLPVSGSVSGTVNLGIGTAQIGSVVLSGGINAIGSVAALQGTNPWFMATPAGSVQAVRTDNASVIAVFQNSSIISINAGSVFTVSLGSIITVNQSSSILAVPVGSTIVVLQSASLLAVQSGTWKTSIAANYAGNSASIVSGIGNLILGVRNDTMSSTLANANGSYSPFAVGSWGDQIYSLAPSSTWTSGVGSTFTGVAQPIVTSVSGMFLNVTAVQIANASANNAYLSFYGTGVGSIASSIIGYTVVPANGGSNILYPIPLRTAFSQPFQACVSGIASVFLSAQGFYSKV